MEKNNLHVDTGATEEDKSDAGNTAESVQPKVDAPVSEPIDFLGRDSVGQEGMDTPFNTPVAGGPVNPLSAFTSPPPPESAVVEVPEGSKDEEEVVSADMQAKIQEKLNRLLHKHVEFVDSLSPPVRRRIAALQTIQETYDGLRQRFQEEMRQLEEKYEKEYAPLFQRRRELVTGTSEPTEVEVGLPEEEEEAASGAASAEGGAKQGISGFWLRALKNCEALGDDITKRDEDVLMYLEDVWSEKQPGGLGFKLCFRFRENPHFTNELLTKTYILTRDEDQDLVLDHAEGTEIVWKSAAMNVTVQRVQQKARRGRGRRGGRGRAQFVEEDVASFFRFFKPPKMPSEDESVEEDDAEEMEAVLEADLEIGQAINDKIIPKAVRYYTGELKPLTIELDSDEDDGSSSDEDDDEEAAGGDGDGVTAPAPGENPPDCKQQ